MNKKLLFVIILSIIIAVSSSYFVFIKLSTNSPNPSPTPNPIPIPTPTPKPLTTLERLKQDITIDQTDKNQYILDVYDCAYFARDLDIYLDFRGWDSYEVYIFTNGWENGHAVVGIIYEVNNKSCLYLVEPQTDESCFNKYDGNHDGSIRHYMEYSDLYISTDMELRPNHPFSYYNCDGQYLIVFGESENDY